jgi:hypothetical protein
MANYDFSVTPRTDYPCSGRRSAPTTCAAFGTAFYYGVESSVPRHPDRPRDLALGGTRIEP